MCDPAQGNEVAGKLSKVEEMIKPSKEKKKKKKNVKYTVAVLGFEDIIETKYSNSFIR